MPESENEDLNKDIGRLYHEKDALGEQIKRLDEDGGR